jgi:dephospho-CoA kinase
VPAPRPRLTIGLTGGIASGKSALAAAFATRGVPVIDADLVSRDVTRPGSPGLAALVAEFGTSILGAAGELDRAALRTRVFADAGLRRRLESILHPLILAALDAGAASIPGPYVVLVVPLLVEGGLRDRVDRVLVVDCPEDLQRQRLVARDGGTAEEAERILAAQAERSRRLAAADDLVLNAFAPSVLDDAAAELDAFYLRLAATGDTRAPGRRLPRWAHR